MKTKLCLDGFDKEFLQVFKEVGIDQNGYVDKDFIETACKQYKNKDINSEKLWLYIGSFLILILSIYSLTKYENLVVTQNIKEKNFLSEKTNELIPNININSKHSINTYQYDKDLEIQQKSRKYCETTTGMSVDYPFVCFFSSPLAFLALADYSFSASLFDFTAFENIVILVVFYCSPAIDIPSEITYAKSLQALVWAETGLGIIPSEIGTLTQLQMLIISKTYPISANPTIPEFISSLKKLKTLRLANNEFVGTIPASLAKLKVSEIDLILNELVGTIPSEIALISSLEKLAISRNSISGSIPSQIYTMNKLQELWLSRNNLIGTISSEIGLLTQMFYLTLSLNKFSGTIPSELSNLTNLSFLDFDGNMFSGTIPSELGLLKLTSFKLRDNNFFGYLPTEILNIPNIVIACQQSGLLDKICGANEEKEYISKETVFSLIIISVFLIIIILFFMVSIYIHRKNELILSNRLEFQFTVLFGFTILTSSIIPFSLIYSDLTPESRQIECQLFPELIFNGLMIIFLSILNRNYYAWRASFHLSRKKSSASQLDFKITPKKVLQAEYFFWLIIQFLVGFSFVTAYSVQLKASTKEPGCINDFNSALPLTSLMIVTLSLAVVGACITTTQISNSFGEFNDLKRIGKALYNLLTFGVAMVILGLVTNQQQVIVWSISLSIVFTTTMFLFVVFAHNLRLIIRTKVNHFTNPIHISVEPSHK